MLHKKTPTFKKLPIAIQLFAYWHILPPLNWRNKILHPTTGNGVSSIHHKDIFPSVQRISLGWASNHVSKVVCQEPLDCYHLWFAFFLVFLFLWCCDVDIWVRSVSEPCLYLYVGVAFVALWNSLLSNKINAL